MASDSLFGGSTDLTATVDARSLSLINSFLTDTVGGSAITKPMGDSTLVVASGDDGQHQGALLPSTSSAIVGSIDDGALKLTISLPANTGFVFQGKDHVTADTVGSFLSSMVDTYLPASVPENQAQRASLNNAITDLVSSIKAQGVTDVVVRVVDFLSGSSQTLAHAIGSPGVNEVLFNAGANTGNELLAFNLSALGTGKTLVLQGVENALIAGPGSVRIDGDAPVRITSDNADQHITGGGGNDTLIGGGGNDTLTGGGGNDVFAFSHLGNFTITDLSAGEKIAFNVPGVTNVAQLLTLVTGVTETAQGVTYHFGPDASITLVGVSADHVTADMIKFTF